MFSMMSLSDYRNQCAVDSDETSRVDDDGKLKEWDVGELQGLRQKILILFVLVDDNCGQVAFLDGYDQHHSLNVYQSKVENVN